MSEAPGSSPDGLRVRGDLHVVERAPLVPVTDPAPEVVLVHGSLDRGGSFGRVGARMKDVALRTYDRRGYAGSWGIGPSEDFDNQVTDLLEVLDGRPALVAGHSFGGNVVLATAARHPELIPVAVVFEPPAPWAPWWPATTQRSSVGRTPEETAEAFMRRMVGNQVWERLPAATREQRRAEGATLLAELRSVRGRRPYDPARLTIPVLVGWGTESPEHMRRAARELVDDLPHATGIEVPGSNHGVHLSHPDALAGIIRRGLALVPPGPATDR